jgi:hypothetical protein
VSNSNQRKYRMRLHLHHPRHALVTSMFWIVALLPWLIFLLVFAARRAVDSDLLKALWPLALMASIFLRESLLETPEQTARRMERIRAPLSTWWILGVPASIVVVAVLFFYYARFLSAHDSTRTQAIAGALLLFLMTWDVMRQYRRGLA